MAWREIASRRMIGGPEPDNRSAPVLSCLCPARCRTPVAADWRPARNEGCAIMATRDASPKGTEAQQARRKARRSAEARLDIRTSAEVKETIERAALLSGRSVTEFVASSALAAAEDALRAAHVLRLTVDESRRLVEALMAPTEPNAALARAAERRHNLFGE